MRISILSVCHNSYLESLKYLKSIEDALDEKKVDLELFFIDNSSIINSNQVKLIKSSFFNFKIKYIKCENIGYFPSISYVIQKYNIELNHYDHVIISNVDLQLSKDFFKNLLDIKKINSVGIYAPSIYSKVLNLDRNPKINSRPSSFKLRLNKFLYSSIITFILFKAINILRLKITKIILESPAQISLDYQENIYAPHGSFIILNKEFIRKIREINFPVFLFCEEIYLAETAIEHNFTIKYYPDLLVFDSEHASTSLMKSRDYRKFNIEALSYVLKNFDF
jgi:hypothetical protein